MSCEECARRSAEAAKLGQAGWHICDACYERDEKPYQDVDRRDAEIHPAEKRVTLIGHCKDCKRWGKRWGDYGSCDAVKCTDMRPDDGTVAFASGIDGELHTLGNFGCLLFEAKEGA